MIGVISVVQKTLPISPEKIKLKILLNTPEPSPDIPIPHISQPTPTPQIQPKPLPKPTPIKTPVLAPSKPTITAPQPTPVIQNVSVPKVAENIPVAVQKASPPPPPPKVEEYYEEENLGRIRSILAARLKYPKNAVRLKQQGECIVTFTLEPNRDVNQITITRGSGFEMLDSAAKELIETSASEFPKPKKSIRISVPIDYKLR